MEVYVLHHYWDTPDNEGDEILGVYRNKEDAQAEMHRGADKVKTWYDAGVWQEDFTWEDEYEIHLGFDPQVPFTLATIYCWEIVRMEII